MRILMLLFVQREEGTYFRAFPWARHLASRGNAVTLMCVSPTRHFASHTQQRDGVRVIETPCFGDGRRWMRKFAGLAGWGPLDIAARLSQLRRGDYDLVHVFEHHPNVSLPVYLAGRRHIPLLVADWCDHYGAGGLRANGRRPRLEPFYRRAGLPLRLTLDYVERDLRRRADGVTVISRYLADRAAACGLPAARIRRITGGAETELIRPLDAAAARTRIGLTPDRPIMAFLGDAQYDLDIALRTLARVRQTIPQALFLVIGRPNPVFAREVARSGQYAHVLQPGWFRTAACGPWLACADVLLLPMKNTPVNQARWPNKIGDYMAAGRPTVCSPVGDVAEVVAQEQIGLVSKPGADDLAEPVLHLLRNRDFAAEMGRRARTVAERKFAVTLMGQEVEAAYTAFAAGRMCRAQIDANISGNTSVGEGEQARSAPRGGAPTSIPG